jgi:DNA anti-recombination protein RmuC
MAWTDERLEERFNGINRRFDEVDRRFDAVDQRLDRVDMQLLVLQTGLNRIWIAMVTGLFGVIAAILVKGG